MEAGPGPGPGDWEDTWCSWLWGRPAHALWDMQASIKHKNDQDARLRAREAAAQVSHVLSEAFAWQAGRWGVVDSLHTPGQALLNEATASLIRAGDGVLIQPDLLPDPPKRSPGVWRRGSEGAGVCCIDALSDDLMVRIFSRLSRRDVITASAVSRRWRSVAASETLWEHVELVSLAHCLGDREFSALCPNRLKRTSVLSLALCWRLTCLSLVALAQSSCGQQLRCLDLSFCLITEPSLLSLVKHCHRLQKLRLFGARRSLTDDMFAQLGNLHKLTELDLGLCYDVGPRTLRALGSNLQHLVVLSLACCPRIALDDLICLGGCTALEALSIVGCKELSNFDSARICTMLVDSGCRKLVLVAAGTLFPNAAPFPVLPPPPPPPLVHSYLFQVEMIHTHLPEDAAKLLKPLEQVDKQPVLDPTTLANKAQELFRRCKLDFSLGNVVEAVEKFQAGCYLHPTAKSDTVLRLLRKLGGAKRFICVRECARAIFLDNDYGNPWSNIADELLEVGNQRLGAQFYKRAKICSRYVDGAGHHPYLNLGKLHLRMAIKSRSREHLHFHQYNALLEFAGALIRAPGDDVLRKVVFKMLDLKRDELQHEQCRMS